MKYTMPKYEIASVETEDILTASSLKYKVEKNDDGSGKVTVTTFDLFR